MRLLTKAEARVIARQARSYGYFADDENQRHAHVYCPRCRVEVGATRYESHRSEAARRGLLMAALDAAMVEHLLCDCERGSAPYVGSYATTSTARAATDDNHDNERMDA
ncbi:MAG TPA: hypothetical protein VGL39_28110 [Jatrophihabitantaceae bacterium]|jgi:hypothetical protein